MGVGSVDFSCSVCLVILPHLGILCRTVKTEVNRFPGNGHVTPSVKPCVWGGGGGDVINTDRNWTRFKFGCCCGYPEFNSLQILLVIP